MSLQTLSNGDSGSTCRTRINAAITALNNRTFVDVRDYGATGNARKVTDAVLNGTTTVTSATAAFTAADVGRKVWGVELASGAARLPEGTITAVNSSTNITVSGAAGGSYSGIHLVIGTDDTTAIKAAATAADALSPKGTVYLPRGGYVITDTPFVQSYASGRTTYCVVGDGSGQTTFFPAPSHAKGSNAFLQTSSNALSALYEGFAWDASHYNYSSNFAVMSPALASTLRDLRFTNHKGLLAFVYAFTGQNYIDRCHFEAAGSEGIHVTGSAVITNSYCGNHFGNGVFVDSGASLTVIGGILDECTYRTVYVASTGKFAAIGATLYGNGSTYPVLETAGEARIDNCRVEPFNTGYSEPGIKCASGGLLQINNCTVKGYGTNGHAVDVAGGEALICNSSLTSTGTGHALNIASGATARLTCTKLTGSGAGDGLANAGTCHDGAGNVADSKSGTAPVTTAL